MGGTQDNGTICWSATGTVSHCRDGDGGYAVIETMHRTLSRLDVSHLL